MSKIVDKLMTVVEVIIVFMLSLEVLAIVAQIIFRYILKSPLSWTDQACRFGLVWIVMLGIPVMFNRKGTVAFDLIFSKTKGKTRKGFEIFYDLCALFFGLTFLACSIQYVQKSGGQSVPGFPGLKFWMLYSAEVTCGVLLSIVTLKDLLVHIIGFGKTETDIKA